ncbi:MAG: (5-formylfuran-3-yl)methyl phosphate synthase [Pirellulales bacterium]|nr:(5-formylfuran-3-yl)methyl phosphate synthase [Pirellulales bacterium]
MTRLLVSVRDAHEALAALDGNADLIDVKEPHRGALGAADADTIQSVVRAIDGRVPTSAALGELTELASDELGSQRPSALFHTATDFAKVGLAGCERHGDWPQRWRASLAQLPPETQRVAVVYADWQSCGAPEPFTVLRHAVELECRAILVDTFDKSRGGLVDLWTPTELARYLAAIRAERMLAVIGGSLTASTIPSVAALRPDYIALRGAACRGDRTGTIDATLVRQLANLVTTCTA